MPPLARRAATALARVLGESDAQSRERDFRVLCLALSRMLTHNDDRCYLTDGYVSGRTGVSAPSANAAVNRLLTLGVVEEITGTDAGESLRARTNVRRDARIVRLWSVQDLIQTNTVKDFIQTTPVQDLRQMSITYLPMWGDISTYYSDDSLRQAMDNMHPESPVWNRKALGPRSMRLWTLISEAEQPVSTRRVTKFLGVRKDRAERYLRPLRDAGLIVEDTDGRWLPGPVRPSEVTPLPEPSPAVPTPVRPFQPQEPPMPDLVPCPCGEWGYPGDDCPACGYSPQQPASTQREQETWTRADGRTFVLYLRDGRPLFRKLKPFEHACALVDPTTGAIEDVSADITGNVKHVFTLYPGDSIYPQAVADAAQNYLTSVSDQPDR